jgi:hypothetical protein
VKRGMEPLVIKARPYTLCDGHLNSLGLDGVLRQCLTPIETSKVLEEFHEGLVGSHHGSSTTMKIMLISYWWPIIHKDVDLSERCDICQ